MTSFFKIYTFSRIGRGIRYKQYFNEYQEKTPEEKLAILNQAKIFFGIK